MGVVKGFFLEVQPPTSNPLQDSTGLHLMKFQKNPPPVQIRSHFLFSTVLTLMVVCSRQGWVCSEVKEEVTTLTQRGTRYSTSCSLFTSFSHSVCLHNWDNRVTGGLKGRQLYAQEHGFDPLCPLSYGRLSE